jgi:hypothetical protein
LTAALSLAVISTLTPGVLESKIFTDWPAARITSPRGLVMMPLLVTFDPTR